VSKTKIKTNKDLIAWLRLLGYTNTNESPTNFIVLEKKQPDMIIYVPRRPIKAGERNTIKVYSAEETDGDINYNIRDVIDMVTEQQQQAKMHGK